MINTIFLIAVAIYLASSIIHNFIFIKQIQDIEAYNKLRNIVLSVNLISISLLLIDFYLFINR